MPQPPPQPSPRSGSPSSSSTADADEIVPVSQSRHHGATDPLAELVQLDGADHFDVIDVEQAGWAAVTDRLPELLGG